MKKDTSTLAGKLPRVVIVGGGFGGLWAYKALMKSAVETVLIERCL